MLITPVELLNFTLQACLQSLLFALVLFRGLYRRLPFFSAYATVAFVNIALAIIVYSHFGFHSIPAYYFNLWASAVQISARSLAVAELCYDGLREYRGIWAFTFRFLLALAAIFLIHGVMDAYNQKSHLFTFAVTIESDVGIASVAILIALLLVRRYYGLHMEALQRLLAIGLCFLCLMEAVGDSVFQRFLMRYSVHPPWSTWIFHVHDVWSFVRTWAFFVALAVWCFALRRPLEARAPAPVLLSEETYNQLSPEVNYRLRLLNERLLGMMKP